jgi:hypothetical protein
MEQEEGYVKSEELMTFSRPVPPGTKRYVRNTRNRKGG